MVTYVVTAEYTAEDGLADLDQRGPFETLADARQVFEEYSAWHEFRNVALYNLSTNERVA